jgi:hypothetical protein
VVLGSVGEWVAGIGAIAAAVAALGIASRERKHAQQRSYNARREAADRCVLDNTLRLLTLIEQDRAAVPGQLRDVDGRVSRQRSPEAIAVVHALNARVGWLALLGGYYGDHFEEFEPHLRAWGPGMPKLWEHMRAEALRGLDEASRFERRELDEQDA